MGRNEITDKRSLLREKKLLAQEKNKSNELQLFFFAYKFN